MQAAIIASDGVAVSGLGVLLDVISTAELLRERIDTHIETVLVDVCATQPQVRTGYGLTLRADDLDRPVHDPPDHLIVPGFGVVSATAVIDAVTGSGAVSVVLRLHEEEVATAAACSGTFVLAEAGVLDGRSATTSWWLGPVLRQGYPAVALNEAEALVVTNTVTTAEPLWPISTWPWPSSGGSAPCWRKPAATNSPSGTDLVSPSSRARASWLTGTPSWPGSTASSADASTSRWTSPVSPTSSG